MKKQKPVQTKKQKKQDQDKEIVYHDDVKVTCSCGASFITGSTKKEIAVEVCSACHPYYTGTQKLVDTSGRVNKFRARLAKKEKMNKK